MYIGGSSEQFIIIILLILLTLLVVVGVLLNDISKRRKSELNLKKLFMAVEQTASTIVITDTKGIIEYVNPKFTELTGYTKKEAININLNILKSGEHDEEFYKKMWETIMSGKEWRGNFCNRKRNGEIYWEDAHISSVKNSKGEITNFIAVKEDITKRREVELMLNKYATIDEMTETYNRRSGMMLLEKLLKTSKRQNQKFAIFFMDVNGLKSVNDQLGHSFGDELIKTSVNVIKACLRESDSICRLGGDEFLIILPGTDAAQARLLLDRIILEMQNINNEEKFSFIINLSFGFAQYLPDSLLNVDDLIHMADEEMYKHKAEIKQKQGNKGIFR